MRSPAAMCAQPDGGDLIRSRITDVVRRTAMSIESFHKASLVHDDIQDGDEFRYGQPTLHNQHGVPTAINVGDYLIGMGYRLISRDIDEVGAERRGRHPQQDGRCPHPIERRPRGRAGLAR